MYVVLIMEKLRGFFCPECELKAILGSRIEPFFCLVWGVRVGFFFLNKKGIFMCSMHMWVVLNLRLVLRSFFWGKNTCSTVAQERVGREKKAIKFDHMRYSFTIHIWRSNFFSLLFWLTTTLWPYFRPFSSRPIVCETPASIKWFILLYKLTARCHCHKMGWFLLSTVTEFHQFYTWFVMVKTIFFQFLFILLQV